ncbi:MAG: hypothetical protein NTY03_04755 [Candidatus Bathyarchaeota archaeon]|nr:hypothetical protein [Candidatus Bathyarchaeota archaeon]
MEEEEPPTTTVDHHPTMGEEVAEGTIPMDASTIGDADPELPTPTDSYQHLQAPTNSNQQATPTARATNNKQPTPTDNVIQLKPVLKKELPPPLIKVKPKALLPKHHKGATRGCNTGAYTPQTPCPTR